LFEQIEINILPNEMGEIFDGGMSSMILIKSLFDQRVVKKLRGCLTSGSTFPK
jgi:hypothetical protein